jgi:hypothetical protein
MKRLRDWFGERTLASEPCIERQSPAKDLEAQVEQIDQKIQAFRSYARAMRREQDDGSPRP